MRQTDPVLIVGAGPSGLVASIDLARRGVPFRVIDVSRSATDKSKAIGIQARTLELFDNMGIAGEFTARGKKCVAANVFHDERRLAGVTFAHLDSPFPFVLMLPQNETEQILGNYLKSLGGQVEREVRLTNLSQNTDGISVKLQHPDGRTEETQTPWVLGCDGAHSTVRHLLDLPFQGADYEEGFLLADVKIDWANKDDELYVYVHDGWLLAAFPLPNGRQRVIADVPPELAPMDKSPTLGDLQNLINDRCPMAAVLSDPIWTANYRIHRRLVSKLREGHAFLIGDSAHIHSPAGAQGMNTGIQDAMNLTWKLSLVASGIAQEGLLDSYHDERYPVEQSVLAAANFPLEMFGLKNPMAQAIRDKVVSVASSLGVVQHAITGKVSELSIGYTGSAIVEDHPLSGGPRAGERAPDAPVEVDAQGKAQLFELLRGTDHKLLVFGRKTKFDDFLEELSSVVRLVREQFDDMVKVYHISVSGAPIDEFRSDADIIDSKEKLSKLYGASDGGVYLIRPDGYIAFRSPLYGTEDAMRSYLDSVFGAVKAAV